MAPEENTNSRELRTASVAKDSEEAATSAKKGKVANSAAKAKGRITLLGIDTAKQVKKSTGFLGFVENVLRRCIDDEQVDKAKDWLERNQESFSLWLSTLKAIEGKFGSAVMVTFAFLKFVFLLNVMLSLLWICFIIFPFFGHPPKSYSWNLLEAKQSSKDRFLESTWVFYGGYNYTAGEQTGWYRTDYMYTVVIGFTLFLTMAAVLLKMATRIMGSGEATNAHTRGGYPFATVIFAGWDFHLSSVESSSNLRRGIRMRLREMLADCAEIERVAATVDGNKMNKRNLALFVLYPMLMACTVTCVVFLVSKQAAIDSALRFMRGTAQPLLLAAVNISAPIFIKLLVNMEQWKPSTEDQVLLVKLYVTRMLNVGTLFYRLYVVIEEARVAKAGTSMRACLEGGECKDGLICCMEKEAYEGVWPTCRPSKIGYCVADCADNAVAKLLLGLIITSTVIDNVAELARGFFNVHYYKKRSELAIEEVTVRVVYLQAIVWVASMFSPVASTLGATSNCITFLTMKVVLMKTCAPMGKAYSATSTSDVSYGLLLITLILSSIPIVFRLTSPSSGICGPVREGLSSYQVLTNYIEKAPTAIWVTYEWLTNPMIMGGVIILLVFFAVLLRAKISQLHRALQLSAKEAGMQQNDALIRTQGHKPAAQE